jgi:hypothetical protein
MEFATAWLQTDRLAFCAASNRAMAVARILESTV